MAKEIQLLKLAHVVFIWMSCICNIPDRLLDESDSLGEKSSSSMFPAIVLQTWSLNVREKERRTNWRFKQIT